MSEPNPFDEKMAAIADSMGIALYQRFDLTEANLFLRCSKDEIENLVDNECLGFIQVTGIAKNFFGYQLLEYLLSNVSDIAQAKNDNDSEKILRSHEVQEITGLSRTTLWRYENKGTFPRRVALSESSVGWRKSDIDEWLKSRPKV